MKCFLGAHGTGKTTLCQMIRNSRPDYFVSDAFSRPIRAASQKLSTITPRGSLKPLQEQVLNFELMMWAQKNYYNYDFVLSTRSLFDSIIFARLFNPFMDISYIYNHVLENKHRISRIFYLPIEFSLEEDGLRYDGKIQREFDDQIMILATELNLDLITLTGSVEKRIESLIPYL